MNRRLAAGAVAIVTAASSFLAITAGSASGATDRDYTVVADDGVSVSAAVAAIAAAGGTVVGQNDAVGMFQVRSARSDFATRVAASSVLIGASPRRPIGKADPKPGDGTAGGRAARGLASPRRVRA